MFAHLLGWLLFTLVRLLVGGHALWRGVRPDSVPRVYFANHASHLDAVILHAALPPRLRRTTHPVAAADYWGRGPLQRFVALRVLNAVLVDRSGVADPLAPLREVLARGESLILFPEGTRRNEALPGAFKPGLFHLAEAFPAVELVPVYLANLARAYPKGALLPVPITCHVHLGPPLRLAEGEEKGAFLERARAAVVALAEEASS